jgi:hypothetical protein
MAHLNPSVLGRDAMPQRQRGVLPAPRLLAGLQARVNILGDGRLGGEKKVRGEGAEA